MGHTAVLFSVRRAAAGRTLAAAAVGALALIAVLLLGASNRPHTPPAAHVESSLAAKGAISNSLGREQPAFYATARRGGLIADNAAQRLTASFGTGGVLVRSGAATFGLQLLAWGAPGHTTPVAPAIPRANANRVSYAHGPVTEWYANGPFGLEQGFDVRTPPATSARDQLTIVLGLRGNARAHADGHRGLLLTGPGNQRLTYSGLSAVDARGHKLGTELTTDGGRAMIRVDTAGAVYPLRIDPFIQVAKFADPGPMDRAQLGAFGVDVQGTTAVAAITTPTAITNPPSAVDVFVAKNGRWEQGATRVAQLTDPTDEGFGTSVALSADAKTIAVGAPAATVGTIGGEGKVYVFEQPAGGWTGTITTPTSTLTGTPVGTAPDSLGKAVSISSDGSLIAAGAPGRATSVINQNFGAVLIFARPGMHWPSTGPAPQATLTHGLNTFQTEQLGFSVALSGDGSTVVAGAPFFGGTIPFLGEAAVFQQPKTGWADDSNPALLGVPTGHSGDFFAQAVAISDDGKTVVAGATGATGGRGAAYVFTLPVGGKWLSGVAPNATLTSTDDAAGIGHSVATDGKVVVTGPFTVAVGGNMGQGAAYVFVEPPGGWSSETQTQRLVASDGASGDGLGGAVGISNGTVIASASGADVAGKQDAGALYAFGSFPSTAISIAPPTPNGQNGWYVNPVSLAVSASDLDSTVSSIRCALDPAAAPISFGALPGACGFLAPGAAVGANGSHVLFASAANAAGYSSAPVNKPFKIDTVAPSVKCSPTPNFTLKGNGGLVAARVTDATSGPAASIVAKRANVSRPGKKSVTLTGRDKAGNAANVKCGYTVVAPKIPTKLNFTFTVFPRFTIFTSITAVKVPRGAKLNIGCKGGGCPFAHRTVKAPATRLVCKPHHKQCKRKRAPALTTINLQPLLGSHHLAVRTVLSVATTKPNTTGVISTFTIRANVPPRVVTKCLAPGSNKPGKGCS